MFAIVYDENVVTTDTAGLIRAIDMGDCVPFGEVYQIIDATLEKVKVSGPWHDPKDPLYITVHDDEGNLIAEGYGTDH